MTRPARRSREGDLAIASDASHAQSPRPDRPDLSGASSLESRPRATSKLRASAPVDVADGYLAVHNLGKNYGARAVVQDVSLYVRRGEAVGLVGASRVPAFLLRLYGFAWFAGFAIAFVAYLVLRKLAPRR